MRLPLAVVRVTYAEAAWVLEQRGIRALAIKGPVTSLLLSQSDRASSDADLLVAPSDFEIAVTALKARGWREVTGELAPQEEAGHSVTLQRPHSAPVRIELDLHRTFPGFAVSQDRLWERLIADARTGLVAHRPLVMPSKAAALLFIALHAARSGVDMDKPLRDLERAVEVLPVGLWIEAGTLAVELSALSALRAALDLVKGGASLAEALALPAADLEWSVRSRGDSGVALFLLGWWRSPLKNKLPLLGREVWPTTAFMRIDWLPPGDVTTRLLLAAHVRRWVSLVMRVPSTLGGLLYELSRHRRWRRGQQRRT